MLRTIYVDYAGECVDGAAETTEEGKMEKKKQKAKSDLFSGFDSGC